ncbi:hypothetical protein [Rhodoferax sp.]|uniref:hypothetical protein n=1 Tax=Rhodoferax sp. TaxID=50421 RepID=UPI00275A8FB9|nr:hypothetical protein [Rhodoferax sp.]
MRYSEDGLFPALETALKAASVPMDCQTLFDQPEIRKRAASVNRVSDYLGGLWRKGLVVRTAAPLSANSRARWEYTWKGQKGPKIYDHAQEYAPRVLADRPTCLITEEGNVITMEFPNLIISIRQKPGK